MLWAATVPVRNAVGRAVLVSLATFMDRNTLTGYPGHERIAERSGCSVSTTQRALARLRDDGLIRWTVRSGNQSLLYELLADRLDDGAVGQSDRLDDGAVGQSDRSSRSNRPEQSVNLTGAVGQSDRRSGCSILDKEQGGRPSQKQLSYISSLAKEHGIEAPTPSTWDDASRVIDELKAQPREPQGVRAVRQWRLERETSKADRSFAAARDVDVTTGSC